jgi:hypothetical protein
MPRPNPLRPIARLACRRPFYLGWALAAYQQGHGLDEKRLAALLGCAPELVSELCLCRRPGTLAPRRTAAEDVRAIAACYGLDVAALRRVVEEAASGRLAQN